MSLLTQIKLLIIIALFCLPAIIVYFFFPEEHSWTNNNIDMYFTIWRGVLVSAACCLSALIIIGLIKVFPLLAIVIIVIAGLVIKKYYKRFYNKAIKNYIRFHTDKD